METPLVSVIIPTYNRCRVVGRAIESVLAQSCQDLELIVVDDGSTDDTAELVKSFESPQIRFMRHEENRGQNAALNTGVGVSSGVYCAFLDSDDEWLPDFLSKILARFSRDPELGCVYCWAGYRNPGKVGLRVSKPFSLEGAIYPGALRQGYVSHMITLVVRHELLLQVGLFDEAFSVCQDDDICFQLARISRFGLIREPLAVIHNDGENQATLNPRQYAAGFCRLITKYEHDMLEHCGPEALAGHFERCGDLWLVAGDADSAADAYGRVANLVGKNLAAKEFLTRLALPGWLCRRLIAAINRLRR